MLSPRSARWLILMSLALMAGAPCSPKDEAGAPDGGTGSPVGDGAGASAGGTGANAGAGGASAGAGGASAGAGGASTGGANGTIGVAKPSSTCALPEPMPLPAIAKVVGSGTAESCTPEALRSALTGGGAITFSCGDGPVTIALSPALQVSKPTVVDGGNKVTLDGGGKNQIMVVASNQSLSVRNLRFINGVAPATMEAAGIGGAVAGNWRSRVEVIGCSFEKNKAGRGGGAVAVWTGSSLLVAGSTFTDNSSWYGGAIYSLLSPLTVVNSVFTGNFTVTEGGMGDGGAIGTDGASESPDDSVGGDITICGTRISDSQGYGSGGGVYIWAYPPDRVTIDRTTVENSKAGLNAKKEGGLGGAMRISNGEIVVKNSSFLSNSSEGNGGGFYLDCAPTCRISNSTFHNNSSKTYGGAIFGQKFETNNVTFANNVAGGHGGALFGGGFVLKNTVFVDNKAGNPWNQAMSCSATGTGDHVLQWLSASGSAGADACIAKPIAADPKLGAPAANGGPTLTMLPAVGSAALGAGAGCEASDQRGEVRDPAACDLGAVEVP